MVSHDVSWRVWTALALCGKFDPTFQISETQIFNLSKHPLAVSYPKPTWVSSSWKEKSPPGAQACVTGLRAETGLGGRGVKPGSGRALRRNQGGAPLTCGCFAPRICKNRLPGPHTINSLGAPDGGYTCHVEISLSSDSQIPGNSHPADA